MFTYGNVPNKVPYFTKILASVNTENKKRKPSKHVLPPFLENTIQFLRLCTVSALKADF